MHYARSLRHEPYSADGGTEDVMKGLEGVFLSWLIDSKSAQAILAQPVRWLETFSPQPHAKNAFSIYGGVAEAWSGD